MAGAVAPRKTGRCRSFTPRLGLLTALVTAVAVSGCGASGIGSGVAAKRVCSEVFVAGRSAAGPFSEELAIIHASVDLDIDQTAKSVTARTMGMGERTAIWRAGSGCLLLTPGPALTQKSFVLPPRPSTEGRHIEAAPSGKWADAIDVAFNDAHHAGPVHTRAVVVLHKGQRVAERYAQGFGPATPMLGWSLSKSATHTLVGLAAQQTGFDVAAPVGFSEWHNDARAAITSAHLLKMTTGLAFDESASLWNDVNAMLFSTADMARFAADRPLAHPPGTHWSYASGSSVLVHRALRNHLGDDVYHPFPRQALFAPIGADSALWETDVTGTFVGSSYLYMSARDWARLGQLYLQDGVWNGTRLLPVGWAANACTPTAASGGRYGAHWWTNGGPDSAATNRPYPTLPADMCWAAGFEQQWVLLLPAQELVIVRLGVTPHTSDFNLPAFVSAIVKAAP